MKSLPSRILAIAQHRAEGTVLSADHLQALGSRAAVDQAFSRLAKSGELMRVGRGLYVKPVETKFGERAPVSEKVIASLAAREGETMVIGEAASANTLGLTTQVPMRATYLTSGPSRKLQLGRQVVEIKHAPRWKLALAGKASGTVLRALAWAGENKVNEVARLLTARLSKDQIGELASVSTRYMPAWLATELKRMTSHA